MFEPVKDAAGNVICFANKATGEIEIKKRVHGKPGTWILDTKTFQARSVSDASPMSTAPTARGPTRP